MAKKKIIESIWGGVGAASEQKTGEDQMVSVTLYDSYFSKRGVDGLCVCVCVCVRLSVWCVCVCARVHCVCVPAHISSPKHLYYHLSLSVRAN